MVAGLLMVLFLALLSVVLWAYGRVLLTAAAAETARWMANADVAGDASGQLATERVRSALADGPLAGVRDTLQCATGVDGLLIRVTCTMDSPGLIGLLDGVMPTLEVTGHSVTEAAR